MSAVGGNTDLQSPAASSRDLREEALAKIWREVLHLPHVDTHANFFEMVGIR
jgi:hypothetical protein